MRKFLLGSVLIGFGIGFGTAWGVESSVASPPPAHAAPAAPVAHGWTVNAYVCDGLHCTSTNS